MLKKPSFTRWIQFGFGLLCTPVFSFSSPAALLVGIGQNFTGSTYGTDSFEVPPDCDGAVGPRHFVEFINGRYSVYSKTDASRLQTMTDISFWSRAGFSVPSAWATTDPRIVYDPAVQRWFAVQIDFDPSGVVNTNDFLLAISATSDPTGVWKALSVPSDPGGNNFADFPTLGLDSKGVYLSGNMFDVNGSLAGATLFSIPKAGLLGATPVIANLTWFGILSYSTRGYILQPAVRVDGGGGGSILATGGLGLNPQTGHVNTNRTLLASVVQNAAGPGPATLANSISVTVPGYTAPINPSQPDGTSTLDDGDARLSATIYRVGGVLFAVHGTEVNDLAALRWYRIDATNYAVLESGTITDPNLNLFYPSIAANTNGTVVIGCNGSSVSAFVSCYAVVGETVRGVTTFGNLLLLKSGLASYHMTGSSGTSRWGDYSATSVDPEDPATFWTIQMYPSSHSAWSTQITQLLTSPSPPMLTISRSGSNVLISWPSVALGFRLQFTPNLSPGTSWNFVTQPASTNGTVVSVLLPASAPQQFFRLQSQGAQALLAVNPRP